MNHAVELMVLHVEHLKKRHSLENTELLNTRKLLQRSRLLSDATGQCCSLRGTPLQLHYNYCAVGVNMQYRVCYSVSYCLKHTAPSTQRMVR